MVKTPEEYLADQEFLPESLEEGQDLTQAEKAFLEKYLGMEEEDILDKLGIGAPVEPERVEIEETVAEPAQAEAVEQDVQEFAEAAEAVEIEEAAEMESAAAMEEAVEAAQAPEAVPKAEAEAEVEAEDLAAAMPKAEAVPEDGFEAELRELSELQLVSFHVSGQEYTVPIGAVQEVVRAVPATKLPETPEYFAGIVNLRGKVTPLVRLAVLLKRRKPGATAQAGDQEPEEKFIVVCRRKGLQVGLLVETMGVMYRVGQDRIEWNIEGRMGGTAEFVKALLRSGEDLVGILSVDSFVDKLIRK